MLMFSTKATFQTNWHYTDISGTTEFILAMILIFSAKYVNLKNIVSLLLIAIFKTTSNSIKVC